MLTRGQQQVQWLVGWHEGGGESWEPEDNLTNGGAYCKYYKTGITLGNHKQYRNSFIYKRSFTIYMPNGSGGSSASSGGGAAASTNSDSDGTSGDGATTPPITPPPMQRGLLQQRTLPPPPMMLPWVRV